MCKALHIFLLLLLAVSCRGPRIIEREDMEAIYYDMFLQDVQLRQNHFQRRQADTTLVYEGIFRAYGYNTDDYLYSLEYYLTEPERMEKIMMHVAERLESESRIVKKEIRFMEWRDRLLSIYGMQPDTAYPRPRIRPVDTLHVRFEKDSVFFYKELDSLQLVPLDSLLFVRDSL